jgi:putative peptide zinc metalloprotease protein
LKPGLKNRGREEHMEPEDKESLWTILEKKDGAVDVGGNIWESVVEKLDFSKKKFKHKEDIEIKEFTDKKGTYYILRNMNSSAYLKMNERELFIFKMLDGKHSVRDMSMAYIAEFNAAPFEVIAFTTQKLNKNNFLEEKPINIVDILEKNLKKIKLLYRIKSKLPAVMDTRFEIRNVDEWMNKWYRRGVFLFFSKPFLIFSAGFLILGIYCFETLLRNYSNVFMSFEGLSIPYVAFAFLLLLMGGLTHELAHGFAVTHFRRKVLGFGFMIYYGVPTPFCDTTDIWMAPKKARILVSFAGPYTSLQIGALFFVLTYIVEIYNFPTVFAGIFSKVALLNALSAILGLNPLLEFDGYYMLMDYLEIPNLRTRSFDFLKKQLPAGRILKGKLSSEERIFVTYGLLSGAYTVIFVMLAVYRYSSFFLR